MKSFYVILLLLITTCSSSKIVSKTSSTSKLKLDSSTEKTTVPPAIIAIEIVDPNENSTSSKNSKRTIDGSLGYGYNNFASGSTKPRYEVYKYSQHDIPPYKTNSHNLFSASSSDNSINIQKSVQYTLPSTSHYENTHTNALQPGTTLYTSLSDKGQTSGLSSTLPQTLNSGEINTPVPVIVLRIYPDQLKDSTIQANLPDNHPFAKSINSIDIQSLLKHYIKALKHPGLINQYTSPETHSSYETQTNTYLPAKPPQVYGPPEHIPSPAAVGLSQYYSQNVGSYQNFGGYQNDMQNYHLQYQQQPQQQYQQQQQQPQYYQQQTYSQDDNQGSSETGNGFRYESVANVKSQIQEQQPQQYYYVPQNYVTKTPESSDYSESPQDYYQTADQGQSQLQTVLPNFQPYFVNTNGEYQPAYYSPPQSDPNQQHYEAKNQELLTHENYPSDTHTKVIFRSTSGKIKTSAVDAEQSQTKDIKTIKIHVPDNIQKVEVQETEKPYYSYETSKPKGNTDNKEQQQESKFYYVQPNIESTYYTKGESPSPHNNNNNYNVGNLSYEQMIKYLATRGVAGYFSQNQNNYNNDGSAGDGGGNEMEISKSNMIKAYEEAFPTTTTQSIIRKKTKNKKKTYS